MSMVPGSVWKVSGMTVSKSAIAKMLLMEFYEILLPFDSTIRHLQRANHNTPQVQEYRT